MKHGFVFVLSSEIVVYHTPSRQHPLLQPCCKNLLADIGMIDKIGRHQWLLGHNRGQQYGTIVCKGI